MWFNKIDIQYLNYFSICIKISVCSALFTSLWEDYTNKTSVKYRLFKTTLIFLIKYKILNITYFFITKVSGHLSSPTSGNCDTFFLEAHAIACKSCVPDKFGESDGLDNYKVSTRKKIFIDMRLLKIELGRFRISQSPTSGTFPLKGQIFRDKND